MSLLDSGPVAIAAAIRAGETSSVEITRAFLARIEASSSLGAFVEVRPERAIADARRKDAARSGADLPPFHGVPIGVKDLNFVRFWRTRLGTRGVPPIWSPVDDVTVKRLRAAGFVILGKTATSEFGAMPVTEPDGQPPARNPWDPERTPGGSSGGSAAAVAAGLVPVAHGSDGGGSIRIPASFCGLVGHKATRGRIPNAFGSRDPDVIYTCGALTRRVADAAAMFGVMARTAVSLAPPPPLRIRLALENPLVPTDPGVRQRVEELATLLGSLGHTVEPSPTVAIRLEEFLPVWQTLFSGLRFVRWGRTQPVTRWLAEGGRALPPGLARERQRELTQRVLAWQEGADVILTPTVPVPPPLVGAYAELDGEAAFRASAVLGSFTAAFNVTGQPAVSVPAGLHPTLGLPVGAQLVGPRGADELLLALAQTIEVARPWGSMVP